MRERAVVLEKGLVEGQSMGEEGNATEALKCVWRGGVYEWGSVRRGGARWAGAQQALLSTETIVSAQDALVFLVCAELDGSIRNHSHHGGRVPAP